LLGTPAYGTNLQVQLYYGASTGTEQSMISVSNAPARLRSSTTPAPGTWAFGGFRTLQGFTEGIIHLQVRVWDINDGATFEQAMSSPTRAGYSGKSAVFDYVVPNNPLLPPSEYSMKNYVGFIIEVPEPSALTLCALAFFSAWMFKRTRVN
jgi:hypothetical protein